ncbi:TetR/AcrR family transcriptional regulator [Vibrio sp.]|nr:TetR/AcrR family transcriptional regulator [Vibrio sp.]
MKTKDRIIYGALDLFNQNGERNVSTNHIAAHIGISPGNLYYHFNNKQEIIQSIFTLYSNELLEHFSSYDKEANSLLVLERHFNAMFRLMWKFRFFYSNLPEILQRDRVLHDHYLISQVQLQEYFQEVFERLIQLGIVDLRGSSLSIFSSTLHMISVSWLSYQTTMTPDANVTPDIIKQGLLRVLDFIKPRVTVEGQNQFVQLEDNIRKMEVEII